jgi:signal transduction histidine kinase
MKNKLFNDKRNRYLIPGCCLFILIIIIFSGIKANHEVQDVVQKQFNEQQLLQSRQTASGIMAFLNERTIIIETLARHYPDNEHYPMFGEFINVYNQTTDIYSIQILDKSGIVTLGYPEENTPLGYDIYEQKRGDPEAESVLVDTFERVKNSKQTVISRPIMLLEGELGIFIWVPVYKNNTFDGVILAIIKISDISNRLLQHNSSKFIYMIDDNGMILYDGSGRYNPGENSLNKSGLGNPLLREIITNQINGNQGTGYYFEDDAGIKRLVAYSPITWRNLNLSIAVTTPESEVDELISSVYKEQLKFVGISVGFILLATVLIIILLFRWNKALEIEVAEKTGEIRESNRLLQKANRRLLELDKAKSDFLSMVSHELKTPLTAMRLSAEMCLEDEIDINLRKKLHEKLIRNIDRLAMMIDDLLNTSQIESGRMKYNMEMVDLGEIISTSIDIIKNESDKKELTIVTDIPANLAKIPADKDRLVQVFVNLLGNAVKFSQQDGNVEIKAVEFEKYVEVHVKDNGIGIPADKLEYIFDKFYQVDSTSSRSHGGSGLGLFITKSIVEEHGGSINVESMPGKGSLFAVTLPKEPAVIH